MSKELIEQQNKEARAALARMNKLIDESIEIIEIYGRELKENAKPNEEILSDLVREHLGVDLVPDWLDELARKALDLDLPWDEIEKWAMRAIKVIALIKTLR